MLGKLQEINDTREVMAKLPRELSKALVMLMKHGNVTNEELAEKSMLSTKQIQRMRNSAGTQFNKETIIAVCVALQLSPMVSLELLRMAGITLNGACLGSVKK
jgi:DNA-binding Xre family transcriptional regulator